uniref:Uncharacterized protein n=1 Tax=viral metagenome TaxID=1070528 RepID=A0A6M3XCK8_9ZZZZ
MGQTNHVKMLRAPGAQWIQRTWKPKVGDIYCYEDGEKTICTNPIGVGYSRDYGAGLLWLPSVGDYMGMVDWGLIKCVPKLFKCDDRFIIVTGSWTFSGIAWVECWCLFVQHECKGLSWDGNIWR